MIINKLTINNFRSYYGKKVFVFSNGLNLILGSNGDGKTTFFEAINWVLTPKGAPRQEGEVSPMDISLVSAKMFSELSVGEKGIVSVTIEITYEQDKITNNRIIERSFSVERLTGGEMLISDRCHDAYICKSGEKGKKLMSLNEVLETQGAFPSVIKKYHLFKGEDKLNIFDNKGTLQNLIDLFSDIKDINPIKGFAEHAVTMSGKAVAGSKQKSDSQDRLINQLNREIVSLGKDLEKYEMQLSKEKESYNEADSKLEGLKDDMASIKKINELQDKEKVLERNIKILSKRIDEEFSRHLLDSRWILMGFRPILDDYNRKMKSLVVSKENIEKEYEKQQEEEHDKERTEAAKTELERIAWKMNDVEKMKYMLHSHRCAFCGTEATEGSITYDFIKQRIHDVIELLTPKPTDKKIEIKKLFANDNIGDMAKMGAKLADADSKLFTDIEGIPTSIQSLFDENQKKRNEIAGWNQQLEKVRKKIQSLNANSVSGLNLLDIANDIDSLNKLISKRENAGLEKNRLLQILIPRTKKELLEKREGLRKAMKASGNDSQYDIYEFFNRLLKAINRTAELITEELLTNIEKYANVYLSQLNVDDFTGLIHISKDFDSKDKALTIELEDKNGKIITNPNTSLLTTMHISILLAISELTKDSKKCEYPLIFDAPTSSFDEGKDKSFYECLNTKVDKQCIVVTKSFLYKNDSTGEFEIDNKSLSKLQCKKFRIKKLTDGFDKLDITTIDTQVSEIKD